MILTRILLLIVLSIYNEPRFRVHTEQTQQIQLFRPFAIIFLFNIRHLDILMFHFFMFKNEKYQSSSIDEML
jgi:hypothetical protein